MKAPALAVAVALVLAACAPATTTSATRSPSGASASPSGAASTLAELRARGVTVAIRVESPPAGRQPGDPAHAQKRAFEAAVATLLLRQVLGASARIELRSAGGDRLGTLTQGQADAALAAVTSTTRSGMLLSAPFARAALVLAAPATGNVKALEDLRGKTIAVAQDELGGKEIVEAMLKQRGVDATLLTFTGVRGAADAVAAGQAAAMIGDSIGLEVLRRERPTAPAVVAEIAPLAYVIGVRSALAELHAEIDRALRDPSIAAQIADAAAKAGFPYRAP